MPCKFIYDDSEEVKTKQEGGSKMKDKATDVLKRVWKKNAILNKEAASMSAQRKLGDFMNGKLADLILQNVKMPGWLTLIGGKKWLSPVVKLMVANTGVFAVGFMESQGYKSKKAEFISSAMLLSGYDSLVALINTKNISAVVDKIIESVPDSLMSEAGFESSEDVKEANDFLKKVDSEDN